MRYKAPDARQAVAANENGYEGHLQLARSLGKLTEMVGPKDRVAYSRTIKAEALRAIELNPSHYHAYMILGIWHRQVDGSSWIEKQIAEKSAPENQR